MPSGECHVATADQNAVITRPVPNVVLRDNSENVRKNGQQCSPCYNYYLLRAARLRSDVVVGKSPCLERHLVQQWTVIIIYRLLMMMMITITKA
ncbi:jg14563 [Pararge aegeria aegeria]|uniref:Jg14563 protein n=1 Tax=Pararge aegeria aegeria TaxID=348720 RepID=A0A8S4SAV9_9NEOP|nr:jg14563 [Pararge aegeria aegeria]